MSTIESTCLTLQKENKILKAEKRKLLIALKNQHQPHMDYIPELDCTVTELLGECNGR